MVDHQITNDKKHNHELSMIECLLSSQLTINYGSHRLTVTLPLQSIMYPLISQHQPGLSLPIITMNEHLVKLTGLVDRNLYETLVSSTHYWAFRWIFPIKISPSAISGMRSAVPAGPGPLQRTGHTLRACELMQAKQRTAPQGARKTG